MAIAGSEVSSSAWTMKRASRALYEIANDDLGDRPEVRSYVETIAKDLATAADGSTSAASDDASAASASATVRIPEPYSALFISKAEEALQRATDYLQGALNKLAEKDLSDEKRRVWEAEKTLHESRADAARRVLDQLGETDAGGDLVVTAEVSTLERLLDDCIFTAADEVDGAAAASSVNHRPTREAVGRLSFWLDLWEGLGVEKGDN